MSLFELSSVAIDPGSLRERLADPAAGAFVAFEGWVRDHNEGKSVRALEYQAYERLALSEGRRLIIEALKQTGAHSALAVHRTGRLAVGELAVWVGVSAAHRGEAFACCRQIIDELKVRLPIWKKELYVDGHSGWVNCERCAHAHAPAAQAG